MSPFSDALLFTSVRAGNSLSQHRAAFVIPAEAGIQIFLLFPWMPALACIRRSAE
jgi:hypothetical protein